MQKLCKSNAERQACLIVMLRCRQSYAKIHFFLRHLQASHRFLSSMLPRMILLSPTDDLFYLPQIPLMNTDFPPAH